MPRILSYTPAWLSHPSPGYDLFSLPTKTGTSHSAKTSTTDAQDNAAFHGPRRAMASRGAEVFVAVGNTIRWADLSMLKDDYEVKKSQRQHRSSRGARERSVTPYDDPLEGLQYKVLKVAVHEPIRQIVPSPNRDLLAIATSHTVHIAIIPDSNHLDQPDSGPLKVRTHTLGPTTHVLSQAPVVSVVWHPLSATGECLVTVTADAAVRMWELDRKNRASFDQPTIDLDLAKLHHATSAADDIRSSPLSSNRGYSMDRIGMEAAAATFGGSGSNAEHGWSPMTLWIAMTEGDVYALCPLLPAKWRSPTAVIPSLTTAVLAKKAYAQGPQAQEEQRRMFEAQYQWLSELDEQDAIIYVGQDTAGDEWRMPVYSRPSLPGPIPKLQGPFRIMPGDQEDDLELSDIHVIPAKLDTEELLNEDDDEEGLEGPVEGLSTTVVCLSSVEGRIYITLCLEDIEGQWLPLKTPRIPVTPSPDSQPELTLLEALDTLRPSSNAVPEWPTFTPDIASRYAFFVNHSQGSFFLSLEPWVNLLESELQSDAATGASFRMAILTKGGGGGTQRERLIRFEPNPLSISLSKSPSACIVFNDSDLGYFLLSSDGTRAYAAELDAYRDPNPAHNPNSLAETSLSLTTTQRGATPSSPLPALPPAPPRQPFQPPSIFATHSTNLKNLVQNLPVRTRHAMRSDIRLDATTLDVLTGVHRTAAPETHALEEAAAEVFRRCEWLLAELKAEVRRANDVAGRVERVIGEDADYEYENDEEDERGARKLEGRLERAAQKNSNLAARHERLRRKLAGLAARPLSENERAWRAEVDRLRVHVGLSGTQADDSDVGEGGREAGEDTMKEEENDEDEDEDTHAKEAAKSPSKKKNAYDRLAEARSAAENLLAQAKKFLPDESAAGGADASDAANARTSKANSTSGSGRATPSDADDMSIASGRAQSTRSFKVPADIRQRRVKAVMGLLERESALVDKARERLERLRLMAA